MEEPKVNELEIVITLKISSIAPILIFLLIKAYSLGDTDSIFKVEISIPSKGAR